MTDKHAEPKPVAFVRMPVPHMTLTSWRFWRNAEHEVEDSASKIEGKSPTVGGVRDTAP